MQTTPVAPTPTRPDQAPPIQAPKKNTNPLKIAGIVGGTLLLLALIGALFGDTRANNQPGILTTDTPATVDTAAVAGYASDGSSEIGLAIDDLKAFDTVSAATHLDNSADDATLIATAFADYPAISQPWDAAAQHLHNAASDLRAGDLAGATSELQSATADMNTASAARDAAGLGS